MPANAQNFHEHAVTRCHEGATAQQYSALRGTGMVVHGKDRIAWESVEESVLDHGLGAAVKAFLFGRLKDQVQGARKIPMLGQAPCSAQQHGHVAIVTAGVHATCNSACMRGTSALMDRQSIHVCTNAQTLGACAIFQRAHQTRAANASGHLKAPVLKLLRNEAGSFVFFKSQLGVLVKVFADACQLIRMRRQVLNARVRL